MTALHPALPYTLRHGLEQALRCGKAPELIAYLAVASRDLAQEATADGSPEEARSHQFNALIFDLVHNTWSDLSALEAGAKASQGLPAAMPTEATADARDTADAHHD